MRGSPLNLLPGGRPPHSTKTLQEMSLLKRLAYVYQVAQRFTNLYIVTYTKIDITTLYCGNVLMKDTCLEPVRSSMIESAASMRSRYRSLHMGFRGLNERWQREERERGRAMLYCTCALIPSPPGGGREGGEEGGGGGEWKGDSSDLSPHHLTKLLLLPLDVQSRLLLNLSDLLHRVLGEQSRDVCLHVPGGGAYTQSQPQQQTSVSSVA